MASLAASAVTINSAWTEAGITGKRLKVLDVDLVLTGQGGTTNTIPASALGLTGIVECSPAVVSDNSKVYPACPNYAGDAILLTDPTNATDGNRANPADVTGVTVNLIVKGY